MSTTSDDGGPPPATPERTGDDTVDAAMASLATIGPDTPLEEHVMVLDGVHELLQRRLTATSE